MRTQEQIADRIRAIAARGDETEGESPVLIGCLDNDYAAEWFPPTVTDVQLRERAAEVTTTEDAIVAEAREYMAKVWPETLAHRPVRKVRIDAFRAYLWLLGSDLETTIYDTLAVDPFGAPRLAFVSGCLGFEMPPDEGTRRMMSGKPCTDFCIRGCKP